MSIPPEAGRWLEPERIVRLRTPGAAGDAFRVGSGYVVAPGFVLTARHVLVRPDLSDTAVPEQGQACRASLAGETEDWRPGVLRWRPDDPEGADVAIVAVPDIGAAVTPVRWGRLGGVAPVRWDAAGYPSASKDNQGRSLEHAWGLVAPLTQSDVGKLGLTVGSRNPVYQPDKTSGWAGLSGAAILSDGCVIGLVTDDPGTYTDSITGIRSDEFGDDPGLVEVLGGPPTFEEVTGADIGRLDELVRQLDPSRRRSGDRALVIAYLDRLAERLNIDNWSLRYGADVARLDTIQQRLTLADLTLVDPTLADHTGGKRPVVDVDQLITDCQRLVILGGPGSGKSWTVRRAVIRAAQAALMQLQRDDDASFADVELPLVANCAEVLTPSDLPPWDRLTTGSLRRAATNRRQARRLAELLADHEQFLIVLDGLDEAAIIETGAVQELIDTHPGTVRIVLTSRPGAWSPALLALEDKMRHRCGTLEPFTSEDRDAAIAAWLDDLPDTRDRLLTLLSPSTTLSRQAEIPLVCALYCLAARPDPHRSGDPFDLFAPGRQLELYDLAIRKLLAATWRDRTDSPPSGPQVKAAVDWLEELAEAGNITNSTNGLGQWPDAITPPTDPDPAIGAYVDNVAPSDPYSDEHDTTRRFIHRSLRERLTASALLRLGIDERAQTIVRHLWFDTDLSEVLPSLLAGPINPNQAQAADHDQVIDQVLRDETVKSDPTNAVDDMLVKAAAVTRPQPATTPRRDTAIEQAIRATLARNPPESLEGTPLLANLGRTAHWAATATARQQLLARLVDELTTDNLWNIAGLARVLAALGPNSAEAQQGAEALLERVGDLNATPADTVKLARALAALAPDSPRAQRGTNHLLERVANPDTNPRDTVELVQAAAVLVDPLADLQHDEAVSALLGIFPWGPTTFVEKTALLAQTERRSADAMAALPGPAAERGAEQLVGRLADPKTNLDDALPLGRALATLGPARRQAQQGAEHVLGRLADPNTNLDDACQLARALAALAPDSPLTLRGAEHLLGRLADPNTNAGAALQLVRSIADLLEPLARLRGFVAGIAAAQGGPTLPSKLHQALPALEKAGRQGIEAMAALAGPQAERGAEQLRVVLADPDTNLGEALQLADALTALASDSSQVQRGAEHLVDRLVDPDTNPGEALQLAHALVALASDSSHIQRSAKHLVDPDTSPDEALQLAHALVALALDSHQIRRGAEHLRERLANPNTGRWKPDASEGSAIVALAPYMPDPQPIAEQIAKCLANPRFELFGSDDLVLALVTLAPLCPDPQPLAEQIADRLANPKVDLFATRSLIRALVTLAPRCHDRQPLADQVAKRLANPKTDLFYADDLVQALVALAPDSVYAQRSAEQLLKLLAKRKFRAYNPTYNPTGRADWLGVLRRHMSYEAWSSALMSSLRRRR